MSIYRQDGKWSKNKKVAFVDDYRGRHCTYNFFKLHVTLIEHLPYFRYYLCHIQSTLHVLFSIFLLTSLLYCYHHYIYLEVDAIEAQNGNLSKAT